MTDNFDTWLEKQDEPTKSLISERFAALEATVKATRKERNDFEKSLKEAGLRLEKGSEAEKTIAELTNRLTQTERKAVFMEKANLEGCTKPQVAFALANNDNLYTEDGSPDFKRIKEIIPELFKLPDPKTNAGSGTNRAVVTDNPNDAFREAAKNNNRR